MTLTNTRQILFQFMEYEPDKWFSAKEIQYGIEERLIPNKLLSYTTIRRHLRTLEKEKKVDKRIVETATNNRYVFFKVR